ncbi:hypothetical protein R3P38DRAFT_2870471 [Favolaschia claudopus]|uniref:Uncharacterized protein n=1 Tax=Favolaschia claudopus TaxID=2862362 RepID=A0AAW0DD26_9AGAR
MSTLTESELTQKMLATASKYLEVFAALDTSVIASIQTEDYLQEFAPASLNPPAPRTREHFTAHLRHLGGILQSFPVRAKKMWPNPSLRQVVVWAESETVFHEEFKDSEDEEEWRYRGEYVFFLDMDERGEKIRRVLEFVDSKGTERLRGLMARAWKKKAKVEGTEAGEFTLFAK